MSDERPRLRLLFEAMLSGEPVWIHPRTRDVAWVEARIYEIRASGVVGCTVKGIGVVPNTPDQVRLAGEPTEGTP